METVYYNIEITIKGNTVRLSGNTEYNKDLDVAALTLINAILNPTPVLRYTIDVRGFIEKVPAIKAVRTVTGLGLKEAKDFVERTECSFQTINQIMGNMVFDGESVDKALSLLKPYFQTVVYNRV